METSSLHQRFPLLKVFALLYTVFYTHCIEKLWRKKNGGLKMHHISTGMFSNSILKGRDSTILYMVTDVVLALSASIYI